MRENWQSVCGVQHGDVWGKETWTNERPEGTCHGHSLLRLHWITIQEYIRIKRLQQSGKKNANWLCLSSGENTLSWSWLFSLRLCWRVRWLWYCLSSYVSFLRPSAMVTSPLVLSGHAARETSCASMSQDVFRHPFDWCLPQVYIFILFPLLLQRIRKESALSKGLKQVK